MTLVKDRPRAARNRSLTGQVIALLVFVGASWLILLAAMPSPSGDPVLRTTSPGSTELVKSPDHVLLTFDRPVPAGLATVRILDPDGSQVVFERPVHPDGRADTISVPMPKERHEGTYAVAWTLPSDRLEPLGGSFTFDVFSTIEPLGVPQIETTHDLTVTIVYTTARVAAIVAMLLLAGAVVFARVIARSESSAVRRLIKYAWWVLFAGTGLALLSFGPYAAWSPLSGAFDPRLLSGAVESEGGGVLLARLYVLAPCTLGLAQLMSMPPAETAAERWVRGGTVLGCVAALFATWTDLPVHVVLLTAGACALAAVFFGFFSLGRKLRAVKAAGMSVLAALIAAGGVLLVTVQSGQTTTPAAIRDQVAPTRLAFDTGNVDLVLIPAAEGQALHLDADVSMLGTNGAARDDVAVTAVLTREGRSVPMPLSHEGTGYLAGSATVPEHGTWELALTLRAGDGGTQTLTQPIDVR